MPKTRGLPVPVIRVLDPKRPVTVVGRETGGERHGAVFALHGARQETSWMR